LTPNSGFAGTKDTTEIELMSAHNSVIYNFPTPTVDPSYCAIISNAFIDVLLNDVPNTSIIQFEDSCTSQPCYDVHPTLTDTAGTIKFKIESTIKGDFVMTPSDQISFLIYCTSPTVEIKPRTGLNLSPEIPHKATTENIYIFDKFKCERYDNVDT
jgi:hypothetical protein